MVSSLLNLLGREAILISDGLTFPVRILDVKRVYGKTRYQISPIQGAGIVWVNSERILIDEKQLEVESNVTVSGN